MNAKVVMPKNLIKSVVHQLVKANEELRSGFLYLLETGVWSLQLSLADMIGAQTPTLKPASSYRRSHDVKAFILDASATQAGYVDTWHASPTRTVKPLRVMMLGLRGFPHVQGGIETHAEHLAPLLVQQGCDLEVIVRAPYQPMHIGKAWQGVKFTRLWAPKSKALEAIVHTFLGVLYAAIKRPDILHIHAIGPALMTPLARILGLKVVVTHHGPDYDRQKWGNFAKFVLKTGEWAGMRFSHGRIVISNVIRELVANKHQVQSEIIRNGVKMPPLDTCESHLAQFGLAKQRYILLVSRLVPEKRHLDLIEAFNRAGLHDHKLVLVGASDHPDAYVKSLHQAAKHHKNIVLTGFQKGDVLRSLYTHAALFVLPSSHEGLSISLLEALSYGLPVLASNIPANTELELNPMTYFELGNIAMLTEKMRTKILNPQSHEAKMDKRAWIDSHYNWRKVAEKTYSEYRKAAHSV
jgi:glycosyltransferase involved in cell wall biosynthesis